MRNFAAFLSDRIDDYVRLRRSLGYEFKAQAAVLTAFSRFIQAAGSDGPLTRELAIAFVVSRDVTANVRARRHGVLLRFAEYLSIFDPDTERLDPRVLPRSRAITPPRILSEGELGLLLSAAREGSPLHPIRGRTLYTILDLLASTGLRSGEALRLDCSDVDLSRGLLQIRRTKFRKDRLVPIHPTTSEALRAYASTRELAYPQPKSPAFFLSLRGSRLSAGGFEWAFAQARTRAGLDQGSPRVLRAHDLRHRFAVTRLVTWYRAGLDVQARLPLLATYLGHVRYSDTAYYVTGTPELLGVVAERAFLGGRYVVNHSANLAGLLASFFHRRLVQQRNAGPATIASYRDALRLLVLYAAERAGRSPCELAIADLDRELVLEFLDHLERVRGNSVRTRNARLTAIRSFFHHVAASDPASLAVAQRVLSIPDKRFVTGPPRHLAGSELDALLEAPDRRCPRGRRDHVLLLFLARTGARVSEAVGVDAADLHLDPPPQVLLHGKGGKLRLVPLAPDLVRSLRALCWERELGGHEHRPVFVGARGERLTRFGVTHLMRRAVKHAGAGIPEPARNALSPHILRHTLAMRLLQAGTDLITIQAWLGHAQVATTHCYAEADVEMMRRSLELTGVSSGKPHRFRPKDAVLQLLEQVP